jgi:DNA-binding protein HU-beta
MKMHKKDLIKEVAKEALINQDTATKVIDALVDCITQSLIKKEDVSILGFGTFKVKHRAARTGRNPRTGQDISIQEKTVPSFNAYKGFKELVNSK